MPIYDVENRFSYYKNYSDNILVGPPIPTMGSSVWPRSVSGSIVSGSEEYKASIYLGDFLRKYQEPFYKSGEVRYIRIASSFQSYQDSYIPDIVSIYKTGSFGYGSFVFDSNNISSSMLLFSSDGVAITGSNNKRINNIEFYFSQPFEKKYYAVKPNIFIENYSINREYDWNNGSSTNLFDPGSNQLLLVGKTSLFLTFTRVSTDGFYKFLNIYLDATGSYNNSATPIPFNTGSFLQLTSSLINSYVASALVYAIKPSPRFEKYVGATGLSSNYLQTASYGVKIQGWKYGLYNGVPTNFSCVFRQNHYGQPRDMLEGRPYTKTYNDPKIGGPLDESGGINFISASALAGESDNWLTASIYNGTNVAAAYTVNPYGSGIFDKEYRASQPWYDNDPRVGT